MDQEATKKPGRPKKYDTPEQAALAHAEQVKQHRERVRAKTKMWTGEDFMDEFADKYSTEAMQDFIDEQEAIIASEYGVESLNGTPEEFLVRTVLLCVFGVRQKDTANNWVRKVQGGTVVSGCLFLDIVGADIVERTHRTNAERSPSYSSIYRELLSRLSAMDISEESSRAIKAERSGSYILKVQPKPAPEPKPVPVLTPVVPTPSPAPGPVNISVAFSELSRSLDFAAKQYLMGTN